MLEAAASCTRFPCESWVHFWKEYFVQDGIFQNGDRLSLFQKGLLSWFDETQVSFQRQPSGSESRASRTLFPCENWVSFERNISLKLGISTWRQALFPPYMPIQLGEETHISLQRIPSVLELWVSKTLFTCYNWVHFERNASCKLSFDTRR